ncbi:hypothetical protein XA68_15559 [Ophiocordyceps unilateralis]|uniref:Uncharacterized protein n=1 Tax=Ophiocordyceps unilateralis TaxID=268505 RepID=A0A2A9P6K8_OPHUN|nr:hypothetical protein XA68_15559 [Ophiocordyceps unilateralis]
MAEPSPDAGARSRRRLPRQESGFERRRSASPEREAKRSRRRASVDDDAKRPSRPRQSSHRGGGKTEEANVQLPYSARPLVKADLQAFGSLFAYYLGVQKRKNAYDMDERELRGRWKRFVRRWNGNKLAEGWYDPDTFTRIAKLDEEGWEEDAEEETVTGKSDLGRSGAPPVSTDDEDDDQNDDKEEDDDDADDYGPTLPEKPSSRRRVGAKIPTLQDLTVRDELIREGQEAERTALRAARKADRKEQKEQLEELAPRAEAGTHERKMEKRRETNDKMRQFRDKSPGGIEASQEKDLMGGGDSVEEYRQMKARERRRKSERQVRREEMERAQREIMEAKRRAWQVREQETVNMLRELARQRFGGEAGPGREEKKEEKTDGKKDGKKGGKRDGRRDGL